MNPHTETLADGRQIERSTGDVPMLDSQGPPYAFHYQEALASLLQALEQYRRPPPHLSSIRTFLRLDSVLGELLYVSDEEAKSRLDPILAQLYDNLDQENFIRWQEEKTVPDWSSLRNSLLRRSFPRTGLGATFSPRPRQPAPGEEKVDRWSLTSMGSTRSGGSSLFSGGSSQASFPAISLTKQFPRAAENTPFQLGSQYEESQQQQQHLQHRRNPIPHGRPSGEEKLQLQCPYCPQKPYEKPGHLARHLERKHGETRPWPQVLEQPDARRYVLHNTPVPSLNTPYSEIPATPQSAATPYDPNYYTSPPYLANQTSAMVIDEQLQQSVPERAVENPFGGTGLWEFYCDTDDFPRRDHSVFGHHPHLANTSRHSSEGGHQPRAPGFRGTRIPVYSPPIPD